MAPNEILDLGLDPFEISVWMMIKRNNPSYPGYKDFKKKLGISRDKLWKALNTLKACNMIMWDPGGPGKNNFYTTQPRGVWITKKIVDKSCNAPSSSSVRRTRGSTPHVLGVVRHTDANNTNSIRLNNKREELDINVLVKSLIKKL